MIDQEPEGAEIRCRACGNLLARRYATHVIVRHERRVIVARLIEEITCEECGQIGYQSQPLDNGVGSV